MNQLEENMEDTLQDSGVNKGVLDEISKVETTKAEMDK